MQRWNRYEATKYAFLDFIGMKPAPTGAGGGIVKRGEIVLKDDMGYVDKLIGWIERHPYLSALGLIGIFAGGCCKDYPGTKCKNDGGSFRCVKDAACPICYDSYTANDPYKKGTCYDTVNSLCSFTSGDCIR